MKPLHTWCSTVLAVAVVASAAHAAPFGGDAPAFAPRVPISAFARPMQWIDPSQLHFTTSMSFGSGFGGGTSALQTLGMSYRFKAPLIMNVSLGNAWGPGTSSSNSLFLQGVDLAYRPSASTFFVIRYQNIRSPLQIPPGYYGTWGP